MIGPKIAPKLYAKVRLAVAAIKSLEVTLSLACVILSGYKPKESPPGYIDNIEDWEAAGKDPKLFKSPELYSAEYERIQEIRGWAEDTEIERKIGTGTDVGAMPVIGLKPLRPGDFIELWLTADAAVELTVEKMAGTVHS